MNNVEKAEDSTPICRICHAELDAECVLYQPCRCMGSIGSVHQECLKSWMEVSEHNYCELCNYKYKFSRPYSLCKLFCSFAPAFWHSLRHYCSDKFCDLVKLIISIILITLLMADFIFLIFEQQYRITDNGSLIYKLRVGMLVCGTIYLVNKQFQELSDRLQSCAQLCFVEHYKPGQMHTMRYMESCKECGVSILTQVEKGLNGILSYFVRILTFHLTCIAAYVYMPYLLLCNLCKLHADNLQNILCIYFLTPAIIRLISTLTLVFKLKRLRFHFYVYGLYLKVLFFLSLQRVLWPLLSGFAINGVAWPQLVYTEIVWQCVKCLLTGFLFNNYFAENLCLISRYLERSYNYLKYDRVLALARTDFSKQMQQELRRVAVLAVGVLAIIYIPAYILRQQETLQGFFAFFFIRSGFKRFLKISQTKKRFFQAGCSMLHQKRILNAFLMISGGSVLLSVYCAQLCVIHELGSVFSFASNANQAYAYAYGTFIYYLLQLVYRLVCALKWKHLKEVILVLFLCPCIFPVLFLFSELVRWPYVATEIELSYIAHVLLGAVPSLIMCYFMGRARNVWFFRFMRILLRRELREFSYKALLVGIQALLFTILSGTHKFSVLVNWPYVEILFYINYMLINEECLRFWDATKELMSPYENEFILQNYNKNEQDKSLYSKIKAKICS